MPEKSYLSSKLCSASADVHMSLRIYRGGVVQRNVVARDVPTTEKADGPIRFLLTVSVTACQWLLRCERSRVAVALNRSYSGKSCLSVTGAAFLVLAFAGVLLGCTNSAPSTESAHPTSAKASAPSYADTTDTSSPTPPTGRPRNQPAGLVERETWVDGEWPFTIDRAVLNCVVGAEEYGKRVVVIADREMYALNGTAKSADLWPDFDIIWRDHPSIPGLKVDIGPMIDRGLSLCDN
jgi:hypothetical protein